MVILILLMSGVAAAVSVAGAEYFRTMNMGLEAGTINFISASIAIAGVSAFSIILAKRNDRRPVREKERAVNPDFVSSSEERDGLLSAIGGTGYEDDNAWKETLDSITDMITIIDTDFNIIYANRSARESLDLNGKKWEDAKCYKYHHGMEYPPEGCRSCECMVSGKTAVFELFEPYLDRHIEMRALPRFDESGKLTGLIHIIRDITDRKNIESRMNRQLERLRALRMIDITITASHDLRLTLKIFLEQVKSQLNIDAASVMLYDPENQFLRYASDKGFLTDRIRKVSMRAGESFAGRVVQRRENILIQDLADPASSAFQSDQYKFGKSFLVQEEKFRSYCGIPLIAKGNVNGVLEVFHRSPFSPDNDWIEFLEALAGQAAIAIENATLFERLQNSRDDLVIAYDTTIEGWSKALDLRDRETEGHSKRVCDITVKMAMEMGVSQSDLLHIRRGALLHDIGKLGVPDSILLKTDSLTEDEWKTMKEHPRIAYKLLSEIPFLEKAIDIPFCHHEKWDGTGYPRGLKGEEIPFSARIFSIVDIWDALSSNRPYRRAWEREHVAEHICSLSGSHLDPGLVEVFMDLSFR